MPQVSVSATISGSRAPEVYGAPGTPSTTGNTYSFPQTQVDLSATQLVYKFSGPIQEYKKARKETQRVMFSSESERNKVRNLVEESFLNNWLLQQQIKAIKALQESSKKKFEMAQNQNKLNLLDRKDWLSSVTTKATETVTILNYSEDVIINQRKLEYLLGQPFDLGVDGVFDENKNIEFEKKQKNTNGNEDKIELTLLWDQKSEQELQPLEYYQDLAIKNRPDLKASNKTIDINRDSSKIARFANLPTVGLYGSTGFNGLNARGAKTYEQFGVTISMPIFDGMLNHYQYNQAEATVVKAMLDNQDLQNQIRNEINEAFHSLQKANSVLKSKNVEYLQAKNTFDLQAQRFEIGDISKVDFENAKTDWENAKITYIKSQVEAKIVERKMFYACGFPDKI